MNLQDAFLNHVRVRKIPVTLYLVGGHQIKGIVKGFDSFIILLDTSGKNSLVYKHAISTITPLKPVSFFKQADEEDAGTSDQAGETGQPSADGNMENLSDKGEEYGAWVSGEN